jgi:hypothetical protein
MRYHDLIKLVMVRAAVRGPWQRDFKELVPREFVTYFVAGLHGREIRSYR